MSWAWFPVLWCWLWPVFLCLVLTRSLLWVWILIVRGWLGLMLACILAVFFIKPGQSFPLWFSPHCYVLTSLLLFKGFSVLKLWLSLELLCAWVTLAAHELWHAFSVIDLSVQYVQRRLFSLCLNCVFPESVIFQTAFGNVRSQHSLFVPRSAIWVSATILWPFFLVKGFGIYWLGFISEICWGLYCLLLSQRFPRLI